MSLSFPRDTFMEFFLNGAWQDVTTSVRQTDPITNNRGRGGEQGAVAPGQLTCKMENSSGNFTPSNPLGQWYDNKIGRGTPMRFGITTAEDTFTGRTVASGWGTATTGEVWSIYTGMGVAGDYAVSGGVGTHSVSAADTYRYSYLDVASFSYKDVEVTATVTVAINDILGASIEPANVLCRHQGASGAYYYARVSVDAAEALTISIHHSLNGQLITPVAVTGLVDAASSKVLRAKIQAEGQTIRAKVYAVGAEPVDWQVEVHDTSITTAGGVGVRNGVAVSNTNTKPIVFSVDNFEVRNLRFAGEIVELKPRWNTTHSDKWAELTASTVLRRIQQGKTPLKSALRRAYLADNLDFPVQYWPCEEGEDAKQFRSAVDDKSMDIVGRPQFGQFKEFLSSSPLPKVNGSKWTGLVSAYTYTGKAQIRFLIAVPKDGHGGGNDIPLAWVQFPYPSSIATWELVYKVNGGMALNLFNTAGASVYAGGAIALALNGALVRVSLEISQNGANVDWGLSGFDVVSGAAGGASGSQAGTISVPERITIAPVTSQPVTDIAIGHIVVQSQITATAELATEYDAYRGESPIDRADRLCQENGINPLAYIGSTSPYDMGPQLPTVLYTLLQECQDAAQGTLHESRATGNQLVLRSMNATYAQDARLTLNYASHQVAPPLQPSSDDRPIRNDVTAKRLVGGEYRVSRETGAVNAQDPGTDDDAVGRYDQQVPVNVREELQLPDVAGWALNLGTVESERFPKVKVNLRAAGVSAIQGSVLDFDLDDRLLITGLSVADYYDDIDLIVRGYTEVFSNQYGHTIEFNCAPYEPYRVGIYGNSGSRYSAIDTTLSGSLTSSATSFTASINKGEPWTQAAANFPLDVVISGERIRISAIAAPSASFAPFTQVFTVAASGRAINGVAKAHTSGDPIRLYQPVRYGR